MATSSVRSAGAPSVTSARRPTTCTSTQVPSSRCTHPFTRTHVRVQARQEPIEVGSGDGLLGGPRPRHVVVAMVVVAARRRRRRPPDPQDHVRRDFPTDHSDRRCSPARRCDPTFDSVEFDLVADVGLGHHNEIGSEQLAGDLPTDISVAGTLHHRGGVGEHDHACGLERRHRAPRCGDRRVGNSADLDDDVVEPGLGRSQRLQRFVEAGADRAADTAVRQADQIAAAAASSTDASIASVPKSLTITPIRRPSG